jgi:hypothetical protein
MTGSNLLAAPARNLVRWRDEWIVHSRQGADAQRP